MAIKPELNVARAYEKIKANKYNENFDILLNYIEEVSEELELKVNTINSQLSSSVLSNLQAVYPVGSLFISTTDTCPIANLFGTWEKVADGRVLQGVSGEQVAGELLEASLPPHQHYIARNTQIDAAGATLDNSTFMAFSNSGASNGYVAYALTGTSSKANVGLTSDTTEDKIYGKTVQPPAYLVNIWKRTA